MMLTTCLYEKSSTHNLKTKVSQVHLLHAVTLEMSPAQGDEKHPTNLVASTSAHKVELSNNHGELSCSKVRKGFTRSHALEWG